MWVLHCTLLVMKQPTIGSFSFVMGKGKALTFGGTYPYYAGGI